MLVGLALFAPGLTRPAAAEDAARAPVEAGPFTAVEGEPLAPPVNLPALDGTRVALGEGAGVSVVHFFATWCAPCRDELPALARFAVRTPQVRVLMVDVGEVAVRVQRYVDGLAEGARLPPGRVLLDLDRSAAGAFGVSLIPSTLVLADGRIVLAREGVVDWDGADTLRRLTARAGAPVRLAGPSLQKQEHEEPQEYREPQEPREPDQTHGRGGMTR